MPFNLSGTLAVFQLIVRPRLVQPFLVVKNIRELDFQAFHDAGYRGAVFDKDNCLTLPHVDTLVPELKDAWSECKSVFGRENVLIVSNSAGASSDEGFIKAESVSHHLDAPVLRHGALKPSYRCINSIRSYFTSLPKPLKDEQLLIVGDRVLTDVVLANRMQNHQSSFPVGKDGVQLSGPASILVDKIWKRESTMARFFEKAVLNLVNQWIPENRKHHNAKELLKSRHPHDA